MNNFCLHPSFLTILLWMFLIPDAVTAQSSVILFPTKNELKAVSVFFRPNKNITFTWSPTVAGARLRFGTLPGIYTAKATAVTGSSINLRADSISLPVGRYYAVLTNSDSTSMTGIQAHAKNNASIAYSNQVEFIIESQTPPTALAPIGNEPNPTPLFRWTSVPGVSAYMVLLSKTPFQVTRDPATGDLSVVGASLIWRYVTTNTSAVYGSVNNSASYVNVPPPPLVSGNEYNYTVLNVYDTENPAFASDVFGGVVAFKYSGAATINAPVLREPADGTVLSNIKLLTFKWDPVANANLYSVYLFKRTISTSGAKQEVDVPFSNVAVSSNALVDFPAATSLTNGRYVWYVSASDANGNGNASKTFLFDYQVEMGVVHFGAVTTDAASNNNLVGYEVRAKAINGGVTPGNSFVSVNDRNIKDSLVTGTYRFTCSKQGYADTTLTVIVTKSGTVNAPITVVFPMKPYPATISGAVTDKAGAFVGNATVKLVNQVTNSEKSAITSSSGQFSINTDNGTYALQAVKTGYAASSKVSLTASFGEQKVLSTPLVITLDQASANGSVVNDVGQPITLATVTASQSGVTQTVTTNSTGAYSLTLTSGTWSITAAKDGFVVPAAKQITLSVGQTQQIEKIILLPNANTINGYVNELITVNNQTGTAPLDQAVVTASPLSGAVVSTVTNAQGQYSLSLKQGSYTLRATRSQYTIASGTQQQYSLTVGVGQTVSGITFRMSANPSSVSGIVRLPGGTPLSGATVTTSNGGSALSTADGSYAISVPPGTFTVSASKEGFGAPKPATVTVTPGQRLGGIAMELIPNAGVIIGAVRSNGEAVANVTVTALSGSDSLVSSTNNIGEFTLSLAPSTWRITAEKSGFIPNSQSITIGPGQRSTGNIITIIPNIGTIRGTVSDGSTIIRNAQIRISPVQDPSTVYTTVSKDDGTYAMTLTAQQSYVVTASQSGYATRTQTLAALAPSATIAAQFTLPPNPASISGAVRDQASAPVRSATVYLISSTAAVLDSVQTDDNGKYTIGTSAGTFVIRARKLGYRRDSASVTVSVGQALANINLTMPENFAVISGTVTSNGAALSGALINLIGLQGAQGGGTVTTAGDGSFIIPRLTEGSYSLKATRDGYSDSVIASLAVVDGQSRTIAIVLAQLNGRISGTVTTAAGSLIASASVVVRGSGGTYNAVTDASGAYSIGPIPLGTYAVSALKSGFSSNEIDTVTLTTSSQQAATVIGDLFMNRLRISGVVRDSLTGDAINGGEVSISGTAGSGSAVTNSKGEYIVDNLTPGPASYTGRFTKTGYAQKDFTITPTASDSLISLTVPLVANIGTITGTVKDGAGQPLPFSVPMKATSTGGTFTSLTDVSGVFRFENVAKGATYTVATDVFKPGYENVSISVPFPSSSTIISGVALVIEPNTAEIKGTAGVGEAEMRLTEQSAKITPRVINTLSDKSFSFTFLPSGTYTMSIRKEGYSFTPASSVITLTTGQIRTESISAVADTSSITITTADAGGIPVPSVAVTCISSDTSIVRSGTTTSAGQLLFAALPAQRSYIVRASKNEFSVNNPQVTVSLQTNVAAAANFTLTANASSLTGRVARTGSATMIANAQVTARRHTTGEQFSAATTEAGSFTFSQLPGDTFTVVASKQGFSSDTLRTVLPAGTTLALTDTLHLIPSTVTVQGSIIYNGKGVADVTVTATSQNVVTVKSGGNGAFTLADLPVRAADDTTVYQLTMEKSGIPIRSRTLLLLKSQQGQTVNLAPVILPSGSIRLQLTDGLRPLEGAKVTFTAPASEPRELYTPSDGIFATTATLAAGEYRISVAKEELLAPNEKYLRKILTTDTTAVDTTIMLPFRMATLPEIDAGDSAVIRVLSPLGKRASSGTLFYRRSSIPVFTEVSMRRSGDTLVSGTIPAQFSTERLVISASVIGDSGIEYSSAQYEVEPTAKGVISFLDVEPSMSGATLRKGDSYALSIISRDGANAPLGVAASNPARGKIAWRLSDTTAFQLTQVDTGMTLVPLKEGTFVITVSVTLDNVALSKSFSVSVNSIQLQDITIGGIPAGNELNNHSNGIQLSIGSKDTSGTVVNLGSSIQWTLTPAAAGTINRSGFLTIDTSLIGKISISAIDTVSKLSHRMSLNIVATIDSTRQFYLTDRNGMEIIIPKNSVGAPVDLMLQDASFGPAKKNVYVRSAGKNFVASPNLYFFSYKGGALNGDTLATPATLQMSIDQSLKLFEGGKIIGVYDPSTVEWKVLPSSTVTGTLGKGAGTLASAAVPSLQSTSMNQLKAQYTVLAENMPLGLKYSAVLPNPFSPSIAPVKIGYLLTTTDQMALVSITIYNIQGELVRSLLEDDIQAPGRYGSRTSNKQISWDGKTDDGFLARNGRYIIRLVAKDSSGEKVELIPVVLIK